LILILLFYYEVFIGVLVGVIELFSFFSFEGRKKLKVTIIFFQKTTILYVAKDGTTFKLSEIIRHSYY
jgi:hypothetical protein